jgi:hypothetical protein
MGTAKTFLSFLLGLLILTTVPVVRTWAVQCPAENASAAGQCHIRNIPDKQTAAPSATLPGFSVASPALCVVLVLENCESPTAGRLDMTLHEDMPVFLKTGILLI